MEKYIPSGICAREINYEIKDNKVYNVSYIGGCNGNLQAISKLIDGKKINEVIDLLEGIDCNGRKTSCADQLVQALKNHINN